MNNTVSSISSLIPTIPEKKPETDATADKNILDKSGEIKLPDIENNPTTTEKKPIIEKYSSPLIKTVGEKAELPSTTPSTSAGGNTKVVDLTKNKTSMHPVNTLATEDTKKYDQEEQEFIFDVEAAHGLK